MRFSSKSGIGTTVIAIVVVVIIIVAAVGAYLAFYQGSASSTTTPTTSSTSTSSSSAPISTTPYTIAFQAPSGGESGLSVLVAQQQGYLKATDPNVQTLPIASPAAVLQALIAGTANVIVGPGTNFISAYAGGEHNITIVSSTLPELPFALIVSPSSNYTSFSQLQNATFAAQAPGGATSILLHMLAQQSGWSTIDTITLQSATATITAVISGKAAATLVDYGTLSTFIGTGLIKVIKNVTNSLIPNTLMATTTSFLQAHPDVIRAAIAAVNMGGTAFDANKTFAQNFIVSQIPSIPTVGAKSLASVLNFSTDGALSVSALQSTVNDLLTYKAITTNVTASSMVTKGYAPINP
ncbi:MAG: ABC transporter substrate-binding protein [Nitrososphaerales archaeon]